MIIKNIDTSSQGTGNMFLTYVEHGIENIVKGVREHVGWTQEKLAKKMGMSQAYIARLEKQKNPPSLSFQLKLAKATGATITPPKFGFM